MGIGLSRDLVNNMVNNVFKLNGKDPYSTDRASSIEATDKAAQSFGGDKWVSSSQMKDAINNPYSHVALTFKDSNHPDRSETLSSLVVDGLDRAEGGRSNGLINLTSRGVSADYLTSLGYKVNAGAISTYELKRALISGDMVIGEGGQLMTKGEAKSHGDVIVAIHENNKGPKIAFEQ